MLPIGSQRREHRDQGPLEQVPDIRDAQARPHGPT